MKTFFTFFSFLFLGVLASVLIAGYISRDNRLAKEAYSKNKEEQIAKISASIDESQKKIDILEEKFKELQASGAKPATGGVVSTKPTPTPTPKPTPTAVTPSGTKLTASVIAGHGTATDCWIIVSGKVYGVSSYLAMHPGGKSVIVATCGKDATTVFKNRGGTGAHSDSAWSLLGQFLIGAVGATVKL
jgi:cytochrome b involved in lipid metabolism